LFPSQKQQETLRQYFYKKLRFTVSRIKYLAPDINFESENHSKNNSLTIGAQKKCGGCLYGSLELATPHFESFL